MPPSAREPARVRVTNHGTEQLQVTEAERVATLRAAACVWPRSVLPRACRHAPCCRVR